MTPSWLEAHASYIDSSRSLTAAQLTFNAGSKKNPALLKVPMIPAGVLKDSTPLTVEITVANDVNIGQTKDNGHRIIPALVPTIIQLVVPTYPGLHRRFPG